MLSVYNCDFQLFPSFLIYLNIQEDTHLNERCLSLSHQSLSNCIERQWGNKGGPVAQCDIGEPHHSC